MHQQPLEHWEKVERTALLIAAALLIGVPVIRFFLAYGTPLQLLFVPFGVWCLWQAFFEDRLDGNTPPSNTEKIFAGTWLWFRRLAVGTVAVMFFSLAAHGALHFREGDLGGVLITTALGFFALWVALFGGGRARSMSDDLSVHRRRRSRYKWWF